MIVSFFELKNVIIAYILLFQLWNKEVVNDNIFLSDFLILEQISSNDFVSAILTERQSAIKMKKYENKLVLNNYFTPGWFKWS